MSESQVVHYMLCCNSGICAPADLVLSPLALEQADSSCTDAALTVSPCEIRAGRVTVGEINKQACILYDYHSLLPREVCVRSVKACEKNYSINTRLIHSHLRTEHLHLQVFANQSMLIFYHF